MNIKIKCAYVAKLYGDSLKITKGKKYFKVKFNLYPDCNFNLDLVKLTRNLNMYKDFCDDRLGKQFSFI